MNKKILVWGLLLLLLVPAVAVGGFYLAMDLRFYPSPPEPDFPTPGSVVEERLQDLEYFAHFLTLDKSYTESTRAEARQIVASLRNQLDGLSDAGFQLGITRAVAAADNGHTNVWVGRFSRQHGRLPLRFHWFDDGFHVIAAQPPHVSLLGRKLTDVGGVPISEAMPRLKQFVGGSWEGFRAYRATVFLELPDALHAVGLSDSADSAVLRFAGLADPVAIDKVALAEDEPLWWSHYYLAPNEALPGWEFLQPELPMFLEASGELFRSHHAAEEELLYIQFRANRGDGLDEFLVRVRDQLMRLEPRTVVIDQRHNGGGDYTLTEALMSDLSSLVPPAADVFMITGNATFSAGINSVAFARAALGDRLTIIGQRIGDRERSYGETNDFELPNSRLGMTFNTGLHDVANGCPPFPACYWRNYLSDVAVGSLDPDVYVEYRYDDFISGRDPVMDFLRGR